MDPSVETGSPAVAPARRRVLVVGATGYIGRHVVAELVRRGHEVTALARRTPDAGAGELAGATVRLADVTDPESLSREGVRGERFDVVVSCLASRTGEGADAQRVDHQANLAVLEAAARAGVDHFVLLSAICVQKPLLAFQHAKLAFEAALRASGIAYSIVRPTAFFKSLSGQVEAVKRGKPFLMFAEGDATSCKPISERDLARFLADCLDDPSKRDAILPIGGPGAALTPKEQGGLLFELSGRAPRFRKVPVRLLDVIIASLSALGRIFPALARKADLARIGRYYATESMLVLDPATGRYDAAATPSYGEDTLREFYVRVLRDGLGGQELGDHAVFDRKAKKAAQKSARGRFAEKSKPG